jgi:Flp pilus assembly protein TadD
MIQRVIRLAAAAFAAVILTASPALADWKRAESQNFVVYSQSNETELRRYVRNLEFYDYFLRRQLGFSDGAQARRKLPIYLVRNLSGLRQVRESGPYVRGTYFPAGEDIFATAIQTREQDFLLHEYFHHFSFQFGAGSAYPPWLIEGIAEYYMTAELGDDTVVIGGANEGRVGTLFNIEWLPLEDLISRRYTQLPEIRQASYYPVAWLLTHWFFSTPERRAQLGQYLTAINSGEPPVAAMERATGMTLGQLRARLADYRTLNKITYTVPFEDPAITITILPRSADDLLLIGQKLKVGVREEADRAPLAEQVRRLTARHPDDPFALLQLGHAELHFGNAEAGEAVLTRLLEIQPDNVEGLQYMAARYMQLAEDRPDEQIALLRRAREYLTRAYAVDENSYRTLELLAQSRQAAPNYPSENDLVTWDRAFVLAPQLPGIRLGYSSALMRAGEFDEAVVKLTPLANAPHGGPAAEAAQKLLERARQNLPPLSDEELEAAAEGSETPPEPGPGEAPPPGQPAEPEA